jgi:DNA-binding IclR family transcriptional regulator
MLAFFDPQRSEAVLQREPDGAKRERLRAELDQIRRDGFAFASDELIIGATAMAAPAFDHTGAVVASVCLYGPEIRLRDLARARYVPLICEAARRLSRVLGHRDTRPGADAQAS